jgi:pantetheine-phosphate adenylyltransferase
LLQRHFGLGEDEARQLIREAVGPEPRVEVDSFEGLLVDYAHRRGVTLTMRGLRAVSDFEYEFQMANMNRKLAPEIETVFVMTGPFRAEDRPCLLS